MKFVFHTSIPYFRGYIALISVLVLSAILTTLALASTTNVFLTRFNELDNESKLKSLDLAYSCAYEALYETAEESINLVHKEISVYPTLENNNGSCVIDSISSNGTIITIYAHAMVNVSYTDLKVMAVRSIDPNENLSIQSWQEVPEIPP